MNGQDQLPELVVPKFATAVCASKIDRAINIRPDFDYNNIGSCIII